MTVEKDTLDYGPLGLLIGKWVGTIGHDVAPDRDGPRKECDYIDELTFSGVGRVTNACEQELLALKYHHMVTRLENGEVFHDQIGHWMYEPATGLLMHSLSLPRGVCLLAGGSIANEGSATIFEVDAGGDSPFGIVQSPFMANNACTEHFHMRMAVEGDQMSYFETTKLFIYGKDFDHTDTSKLTRVSG